ncbi:MAG: enoyl-ACP reductase [Gammaproteobacteria bacterium]|nr:enoyl-ACP reductase [Gammaproteobacteria bacterium]
MGFLDGKRALVLGIASNRSIAWGIARALAREGAELALTYQTERLGERVHKFAEELGGAKCYPCEVTDDASIDALFSSIKDDWDGLDIIVHSIAFAPREALAGDYVDNVNRESFAVAHDISAYSFLALARAGREMMRGRQAAMLTLTYLGSTRVLPNYNVMGPAKASLEANLRYMAQSLGPDGIRVNAISAGPIRTLAASGIGDFRKLLDHVERTAPLRKNVTIDEVGNAAAFLCSDLAAGITGEITYVDAGYSTVGSGEL